MMQTVSPPRPCGRPPTRPFVAAPAAAARAGRQRRQAAAAAAGPASADTSTESAVFPSEALTDPASLASKDLRGTVAVTGAGVAGLAAAAAISRAGLPVVVLERSGELPAGGSALGLWTNAWRALDALGAAEPLRRQHPALQDVELVREGGRRLRRFSFAECDGGPHEFRGVRRANLLAALAERLPASSLALGATVAAAEATRGGGAALVLESGQLLECLAVVGADGARSAVATATGRPLPNYCGQSAIRGVARFPGGIPAELKANCIRQVWGPGARAGTYAISDTELYWFVCFFAPEEPATPPSPAAWRAEALSVVRGWAWGLPEAVQATPDRDLSRSRLVDRWDLPPLSTTGGSSITLAGDALHPMTPNLGQGGCTALEDGLVLARCLQQQGVPALAGAIAEDSGGASSGSSSKQAAAAAAVQAALRQYERERAARCLPLTVRSHLMGAALQAPIPPLNMARDLFVQYAFSPSHFLDHATYDCGRVLPS